MVVKRKGKLNGHMLVKERAIFHILTAVVQSDESR